MIKKPVVAGSFYPNEKSALANLINTLVKTPDKVNKKPFAIISPHAGFDYSGKIAGYIYGVVKHYKYKNAIIIAPSHYSNSCDFFIGNYSAYHTPIGDLKTNQETILKLIAKPGFNFNTNIDSKEHSLETQLPFLKYTQPDIKITPIIFVRQTLLNAKRLAAYLQEYLDNETLLVISTDLSHFHNSKEAEVMDNRLIGHIKNTDIDALHVEIANKQIEACGFGGLLTLMFINRNMTNVKIDYINYTHSGNITGDKTKVVGYFSCGFYRTFNSSEC